eukprot:231057-Prorocentrum_minimum.AAC.1
MAAWGPSRRRRRSRSWRWSGRQRRRRWRITNDCSPPPLRSATNTSKRSSPSTRHVTNYDDIEGFDESRRENVMQDPSKVDVRANTAGLAAQAQLKAEVGLDTVTVEFMAVGGGFVAVGVEL